MELKVNAKIFQECIAYSVVSWMHFLLVKVESCDGRLTTLSVRPVRARCQ